MFRRVESRVGRFFLYVGAFLLATLLACIPIGVFGSSNIVWGEPNQDGRVAIPSSTVVHFSSGTTDAAVAVYVVGKGNESVDLPIPSDLSLVVAPVGGGAPATLDRDLGSSSNTNDSHTNTVRRVWHVDIPKDGDYRVTTHGGFVGVGLNPELWFGHGPPIPGVYVPFIGAVIAAIGFVIFFVLRRRRKGRPGDDPDAVDEQAFARPAAVSSAAEQLTQLAALHERGELTDAEFVAEKAKIIGGG